MMLLGHTLQLQRRPGRSPNYFILTTCQLKINIFKEDDGYVLDAAGLESAQRRDWLWDERMHRLFGSCQEFQTLPGSPCFGLGFRKHFRWPSKCFLPKLSPPAPFPLQRCDRPSRFKVTISIASICTIPVRAVLTNRACKHWELMGKLECVQNFYLH